MKIIFYDILAWLIILYAFVYAGYRFFVFFKNIFEKKSICNDCPLKNACTSKDKIALKKQAFKQFNSLNI